MKILFLIDNFPPEVNAAASRVYERARYWAQWGHDVTIFTSAPNFPQGKIYPGYKNKWYQTETIDGIKVIRVKTFIFKNKGRFFRTIDHLSYFLSCAIVGTFLKKPDIVIASTPQFFTGFAGWFLSLYKRKPFVLEVADLFSDSLTASDLFKHGKLINVVKRLEIFLYKRAAKIIVLTESFKKNMVSAGISAEKIETIVNGVELDLFKPTTPSQTLLKQHKLTHKFIAGYIGTHGMCHDLENILKAADYLKGEPDIHFLLVGDGAYKNRLVDKAKKMGLHNITFTPPQSKQDIVHYWNLCQLALVNLKNKNSLRAIIPAKLFEAMATGLPILLASPQGEASDIIESKKAGIWIEAGNPRALADHILKLKNDKELCQTFSENSLSAASQFTREIQARKFMKVLEKHLD